MHPESQTTMGTGRNLSLAKRAQAVALKDAGFSHRRIANRLHCSKTAVTNAICRFCKTGSYKDRRG